MIAHAEKTTYAITPLGRIELACERLRDHLNLSNKVCDQIDREIEAVKAKHRDKLQHSMEVIAEQEQILTELVNANRELFPDGAKTQTFSGIEVGFQKEQDKVEIPDEETLIKRIEAMLPEKKDTLIATKKSVIKAAFKKLAWAVKQKLGCSERKGADQLVIRLTKDDARKRASAYLIEAQASQERAA